MIGLELIATAPEYSVVTDFETPAETTEERALLTADENGGDSTDTRWKLKSGKIFIKWR